MIDLSISPDGSLSVSNGDLVLLDGAERVRQQIEFKLSLWRGEWFTDVRFGTPYLQNVLGKQISLNGAINAIKSSVMAVDGVQRFSSFRAQFNRQTRTLDVTFEAVTPYGIVKYGKQTS